jgi:phospholipid transport system substrate-binding protein
MTHKLSLVLLPACLLSACLSLAFLAAPVVASAQGGPATRYLRGRNDEVNTLLRDEPDSPARTTRVTALLNNVLDYEELSRRALGTHWEGRTPAQRTEFVGLLRQLVEQQYQSNMQRLLDYEIAYTAEAEIEGGRTVSTSARSRTERRQPAVEIVYTAHLVGDAWRVYDVTTDGVSMVRNYQQQFNRIIAADGWDALITRMRERLTPH